MATIESANKKFVDWFNQEARAYLCPVNLAENMGPADMPLDRDVGCFEEVVTVFSILHSRPGVKSELKSDMEKLTGFIKELATEALRCTEIDEQEEVDRLDQELEIEDVFNEKLIDWQRERFGKVATLKHELQLMRALNAQLQDARPEDRGIGFGDADPFERSTRGSWKKAYYLRLQAVRQVRVRRRRRGNQSNRNSVSDVESVESFRTGEASWLLDRSNQIASSSLGSSGINHGQIDGLLNGE